MQSAIGLAGTASVLRRLNLRHIVGNGVNQTGDQTVLDRIDCRYTQSDGLDGSGSTAKTLLDCISAYNDNGASSGSDGDDYSNHGGTIPRTRCLSLYADTVGFDDTENGATLNDRCFGIGSRPLMSAGNTATRSRTCRNSIFVVPDGMVDPYAFDNRGAIAELDGCTLFGIGSATGKSGVFGEIVGFGNPATTVKNCIIDGFATGLNAAAGTISEDYNDNHATAAETTGVTSAGHWIAAAPQLNAAASLDLRPIAKSGCKGAGAAIAGLEMDHAGALRAMPPTIGALEAA